MKPRGPKPKCSPVALWEINLAMNHLCLQIKDALIAQMENFVLWFMWLMWIMNETDGNMSEKSTLSSVLQISKPKGQKLKIEQKEGASGTGTGVWA